MVTPEPNSFETVASTDEAISALMDGVPSVAASEAAWRQLQQPEGAQTWALYHLIGDTLRSIDAVHCSTELNNSHGASHRTHKKIMDALLEEPALIAQSKPWFDLQRRTAHRHALPIAAAAAAVALVGWVSLNSTRIVSSTSEMVAQVVTPKTSTPATLVATKLPAANHLADYVAAHQQYSPVAQLYGPSLPESGVLPVVAEVKASGK